MKLLLYLQHFIDRLHFLIQSLTYLLLETISSRVMGWVLNRSAFLCNLFFDDSDSRENNWSKIRTSFSSTNRFSTLDGFLDEQNECSLYPQGLTDRRPRIRAPAKIKSLDKSAQIILIQFYYRKIFSMRMRTEHSQKIVQLVHSYFQMQPEADLEGKREKFLHSKWK